MAVKYYCPKCGRRFVDWGAEKLEFKCPSDTCEGEVLVLLGSESADGADSSQKVKRAKKRKAILPSISADIDVPELDGEFDEDVEIDEDDEELEVEEDDEEVAPVIAVETDTDDDELESEDTDDAEDIEDDETFSDAIDIDDDEFDEEEE